MEPFIDYYAVLGVPETATTSAIKSAFKHLALQYHPDVYKGQDAQERMRALLLAYQTLSDEASRRSYDALRSEHLMDRPGRRIRVATDTPPSRKAERTSSGARRDRQRSYDFPNLYDEKPAHIDLDDITYDLSPSQATTLRREGMLRGVEQNPQRPNAALVCHRCHHQWVANANHSRSKPWEDICPSCKASDWSEYLLLHCIHCAAVFESEQIRYEIGSLHYGDADLCPPYELFPLCPYCGAPNWCPAEDARVSALREAAATRAAKLRLLWICIAAAVVLVLGVLAFAVLR